MSAQTVRFHAPKPCQSTRHEEDAGREIEGYLERCPGHVKLRGDAKGRTILLRAQGDQVIRENPSAARGFAGAPKNRQRILSVHRGGCSWNAGPQQWYEGSEALQGRKVIR